MSQIFLSYARDDKQFAEALANSIEAAGYEVWWDEAVPSGVEFRRHIDERLRLASCIIVCWSKASVSSRWVLEEAEEGAARGILVPVLCQDVEIPRGFRGFQTVDLIEWDGESDNTELKRLLDTLRSKGAAQSNKPFRHTARSAYNLSLRRKATRNTSLMAFAVFAFITFAAWDFFEPDGGLIQNRFRLAIIGVLAVLGVLTWFARGERAGSWIMCCALIVIGIAVMLINYAFTNPELGLDKYAAPLNLAIVFAWGIGVGAISAIPAAVVVVVTVTIYAVFLITLTSASSTFIAGAAMNLFFIGAALVLAKWRIGGTSARFSRE